MVKVISFFIAVITIAIHFVFAQQEVEKCGTYRSVKLLHQKQKTTLELAMLERPAMQRSELTSSKRFRVHYDTSGINEPALLDANGNRIPQSYRQYIDTLKYFLDSVWRAEIDAFGFIPPPSDSGRGGGDEYDFYVVAFFDGTFGETVIEGDSPVGPPKTNQQYTSFIKIENDFAGYRTTRDSAVAVTCAHEFHHAIQVGGSGVWEMKDYYFYELCAQSMEPTVFPHVKDYIFDLKTYYSNISILPLFLLTTETVNARSFGGYERAIWGYYLIRKYGVGVMKAIWDEMKTKRPVSASQAALNTFSTSLEREFKDFVTWNFYTGKFADSVRYFPDAKLFPPLTISNSVVLNSDKQQFTLSARAFTTSFFTIRLGNDSVFIAVSNVNYNDAVNDYFTPFPFQLTVAPFPFEGSSKIYGDVYAQLTVSDQTNWSSDSFIRLGIIPQKPMPVFPNPYNPLASSLLFSTEGLTADNSVTLTIYSASMDLVYSRPAQFQWFSGTQYAQWNGRDNNGRVVPSGIYVYVLSRNGQSIKGKFAVIR